MWSSHFCFSITRQLCWRLHLKDERQNLTFWCLNGLNLVRIQILHIQCSIYCFLCFCSRGIKHRSLINDLPLPISTADSRLNYWLINTPYQFKDWWPWKAVDPEALRDQAKETVLNMSNLVDSGGFLVNGGLRCLVAYPHLYSETDGSDRGDIFATKIDVFYVVYVWKSYWVQVLYVSMSGNTSNSTTSSTHTHTHKHTDMPHSSYSWVPNNDMFNPHPFDHYNCTTATEFLLFLSHGALPPLAGYKMSPG